MSKEDHVSKLESRVSSIEQRVGSIETKLDSILKALAGAGPSLSSLKGPGGLFSRPAAATMPPESSEHADGAEETDAPISDMLSTMAEDPDPPTSPDIVLAARASQRSTMSLGAAA
mmetsp:Transcript_124754/g.349435  ORF Transcript_124754/g.349435 Transcript_124754/m.349435 type:complete len:116 (+) Transcript_124754:89-436(+)